MIRWRVWLLSLIVLVVVSGGAFTAGVEAERSGIMPGSVQVEPSQVTQ